MGDRDRRSARRPPRQQPRGIRATLQGALRLRARVLNRPQQTTPTNNKRRMKRFLLALMGMIIGLATTSVMGATLGVVVGATPAAGALALDGIAVGTSLMGGLAPTGTLRAGLYPEAWTGELIKAFRAAEAAVGWYNKIRSYDQYVEKDIFHMVDIGADPEVLVNNTTYPLETETLEDGDVAVKLDKFQTKPTRVTDDELHAIGYDKMASVVERHKEAFSETKFSRAIHSIAPAEHKTKTPVLLTTGEVVDDRKRLTRSDIIALKKAFDKAKIPAEGRILVLCADHVADLLEQDQKFAAQYYNYESGAISRLYGFEVYEFNECPYFNTTTKKKLAYGAVPTTADRQSSVAFSLKRTMKANGSTKTYLQEAASNPTTQENLFSMRTYTICLPTKTEGLGAIVSAPKAA
nr:MAG TPA: major capsid protein [Bacteriophage sp.]